MTIDEMMKRLEELRSAWGGDVPVYMPGDEWNDYDDRPLGKLEVWKDPQRWGFHVLLKPKKDDA